ncbi:MAG: hypothetical protein ACKVWR_12825 [Acidimicrobiales bacterium]
MTRTSSRTGSATWLRRMAAIGLALALLGACAGGDDPETEAAATSLATTTTLVVTTTAAPTTTTAAPTTTEAPPPETTTTEPPPPETTTTEAPPATEAPAPAPALPSIAEERQAVSDVFTTLLDPNVPFDQKAGLIDDASGLEAANGVLVAYANQTRFSIDDVTVNSRRTSATVTFDVLFNNVAVGNDLKVNAVKRNGSWLVTKQSFCTALGPYGITC